MVTPSSDHNYIETIVPRIAGFVPSSVLSLKSATHHIAYYDGLGRPVQTIDYKASPDRKDIISLQEYDEQGRAGRQWLPTERCRGVEGRFSDSERLSRDIQNYYEDVGAFSYPVYEDCPLNRMNESYGPGEEWHVAGKSHRQRYRTNTPADRCLYFELEGPSACPKPRLPIPTQPLSIRTDLQINTAMLPRTADRVRNFPVVIGWRPSMTMPTSLCSRRTVSRENVTNGASVSPTCLGE